MIEEESIVAAVERSLEFVARRVDTDLEFCALFGRVLGKRAGEERVIQKLIFRLQMCAAVVHRVVFRGNDPLRGLRVCKQHGCCQHGDDPRSCDG